MYASAELSKIKAGSRLHGGLSAPTPPTGANVAEKNAIPVLIYLDIFKNYFANTQEDNFYIIAGSTEATITFEQQNEDAFTIQVGQDAEHQWATPMNNTVTLQASDNVKNFGDFWTSLIVKVYNPSNGSSLTVYINNATTNYSTKRLDANSIYNSPATGATIPKESKNTPAYRDW